MVRTVEKGKLMARILAGSWRPRPAPLEISADQLTIATPGILASGAAALAWKRVCQSELRASPAALELEQAYRLHSLQYAIHEHDLQNILPVLARAGIESVLVKGWATAN
jgi:hypothetical protein